MTLPTMKAGDRVRITVEGEVRESDRSRIFVMPDSSTSGQLVRFDTAELTAPTARVEVLPPPIDPDLVLAREWFKGKYASIGDPLKGDYDTEPTLDAYLAGLKASKAGGRV